MKTRNVLLLSLLLLLVPACSDSPTAPVDLPGPDLALIQSIIADVNLDSLTRTVDELSGEVMAPVGGQMYHIYSRKSGTTGNQLAAQYLYERLQSYGLETEYFTPLGRLPNVIGTKTGTMNPDRFIILSAHFDDVSQTDTIPGADDNASGTATVLEAARLISKCESQATIIFALFNEEEQGLLGSNEYAKALSAPEYANMEVINVDMIGWDFDDDDTVEVHAYDVGNSPQLADTLVYLNNLAGIGLNPVVYNPGNGSSDHRSFWEWGRPAILVIEETRNRGGDFNANYHSRNDLITYFNMDFFHSCARLSIGGAALMARVYK